MSEFFELAKSITGSYAAGVRASHEVNELRNRQLLESVRAVVAGYRYDPGDSDLDDEQPINVHITLGEYRRLRRLL